MLESFFRPRSVAVIGASRTPGKVGYDIVGNLLEAGFQGKVYPINPKADEVLGQKCYPSLSEVPGEVELAVIAIPARFVPAVIDECAQKGTRAVIVISAGFKESGEEGAELERQLKARCAEHGIRCIGPNCLGVMSPPARLDVTFSAAMPKPGDIAFFSQSGALGTAILDTAVGEDFGLSCFVSVGNKADVDETDLIEALAADEGTDVVLGYLESISDGRRFMDVAARVTRSKPVVVFKSGRSAAGARAASSHTGSLAGSDAAYEAAFKQCGVVRARTITEFFDFARAFACGPVPRGSGVAIVTNAGGPGIVATDMIEQSCLEMAGLSEETIRTLVEDLPPQANIHNPIDVLGDAKADRYRTAIEAVCRDPNVHSILVILTPQTSTEVEGTARVIAEAAEASDKAMVATFMGTASVRSGWKLLDKRGVPNYSHPDRAVRVLEAMAEYARWQKSKPIEPKAFEFDAKAIRAVIDEVRASGAGVLQENEARKIAGACGIPLPLSVLAADADAAVGAAEKVGYPVVLKISSEDILHKSDAGGVKVGLADADAVRAAFEAIMAAARNYKADAHIDGILVQQMAPEGREVIIGVNRDAQFGPIVMFGLGGVYVEVLKDITFRVAPLTERDAEEMIGGIRAAEIFEKFRGLPPADTEALADVLMRVSQLAVQFPEIAECDLNPVRVYAEGQGVMALDVRFALT